MLTGLMTGHLLCDGTQQQVKLSEHKTLFVSDTLGRFEL
jgi:hypothetical protein